MLLLLLLVHLLTKNGTAAPIPLPLASRFSAGTCDDINNCRKLFDIVWGCLATIFACTWVSVHPNVPPPNQSRLQLFWRRLKMMLLGIIAPEIMVAFAARQRWGARMLSKEYGFSKTHGFFFCMGGFVSSTGYPIVTGIQLNDPHLGPEFLKGIQNIRAEDITYKSKGDALSKGVALAQGLWFCTQCLARVHQHLTVTELEVSTLAFAVVNIFIWLLWWEKPLDVQQPLVVGPPMPAQSINSYSLSVWYCFVSGIVGHAKDDNEYDPLSSTSVPLLWSLPTDYKLQYGSMGITALAGSVFGAINCTAWNTDFPTTAEKWIWRSCSLMIAAIPVVMFLALLSLNVHDAAFDEKRLGNAICILPVRGVVLGGFHIHSIARFLLIPLPLVALRSLPSSAFVDVNWSTALNPEHGPLNSDQGREFWLDDPDVDQVHPTPKPADEGQAGQGGEMLD
ncbi:hypothetical protein K438DRAFT_1947316 [Mycena galopus ATCC 62051]|nr:hypothetical protein K438DRAFT_1947316 [Mycena galopus ATCC 62051]